MRIASTVHLLGKRIPTTINPQYAMTRLTVMRMMSAAPTVKVRLAFYSMIHSDTDSFFLQINKDLTHNQPLTFSLSTLTAS